MVRASLALVCLSLGCTSVAAGQEPRPQLEHAYAHASCAPWDGAAVRVVLSPERDTSLVLAGPPRPGLELAAYAGLTRALGRAFRVRPEAPNDGRSGGAWWCDAAGRCSAAARGWIYLEGLERDSSLAGSYEVGFTGRGVLRGRFTARWLSARPLCG